MKHLWLATIFFGLTLNAWGSIDANFEPPGWLKFEGDHFVVLCPPASDEDNARAILDHAENYYNNIADDIGYTRYQNFWTWGDRVKIILFGDQDSYTRRPASHHGPRASRLFIQNYLNQGLLSVIRTSPIL